MRLSPYNVVRLVLPEGKNGKRDYRRAEKDLKSWSKKGILKKDISPSFYIYSQECVIEGKRLNRFGILSVLNLEQKGNSGVLPHENVFSKPMQDRVELMKHTKAHLSPVFIVFKDTASKAAKTISGIIKNNKPDSDISFEGTRNKIWQVSDASVIDKLSRYISKADTFIADGHHRFKASTITKAYFDSKLNKRSTDGNGHTKTLVYLVSSQDKGLKILPTHRAVKILPKGFSVEYIKERLNSSFDIKTIPSKEVDKRLKTAFINRKTAFVLYYNKKYILLILKDKNAIKNIGPKGTSLTWKRLDVSILHNLVFAKLLGIKEKIAKERNIYYYKGKDELIKQINSGRQSLGVILNPSTLEDMIKLAKAGEKMPHKSTYFYPKPLTGMVIHKF
jgi:uncharacterized protein (DUF1015 family)